MKPFEIQSPSLSINGVLIDTSAQGKLVIPGVTRAGTSVAIEVEDTGDQSYSFGANADPSTITVIDGYQFAVLNGDVQAQVGWTAATYSADEIDDEGYIDGISVVDGGAGYTGEAVTYSHQMLATEFADPLSSFDPSVWTWIPFRVRCGAGEIESEFGSGGGADTGDVRFDGTQIYVQTDDSMELHVDTEDNDNNNIELNNKTIDIYAWNEDTNNWSEVYLNNGGSSAEVRITVAENDVQKDWTFDKDGGITFPDNTVQTTAYTGGSSGGGASVTTSDTAPSSPSEGDLWFDIVGGQLYVYFEDTWVDSSPSTGGSSGSSADTGNISFVVTSLQSPTDSNVGWPNGVISLMPGAATDTGYIDRGQYLNIYPTIGYDEPHIHIAPGFATTGSFSRGDLILGDDSYHVSISNDGNVYVKTNGQGYAWTFGDDGNLTIPSNINYSNGVSILDGLGGGTSLPSDAAGVLKNDGTGTLSWSTLDVQDLTDNSNLLGGSGGGTSLPSDAAGYLHNDGSGGLSWTQNTAGTGTNSFSDVWVTSTKASNFWTTYTLTGNITLLFNYGGQPVSDITLSNQAVSGKQITVGQKILVINDAASLNSNSYGIVIEFPSSPSVGDTFSAPVMCPTALTTISVSQMQPGQVYTIVSLGTTNWGTLGVYGATVGQQFQYNGGSITGDGTVSTSGITGVSKVIFKPASGHRAISYNQGNAGSATIFGQGATPIASYTDLTTGMGQQPITWVYAGIVDSIPTWYQIWG
jgi:hypothetical protein